jgi:hypothetical protein
MNRRVHRALTALLPPLLLACAGDLPNGPVSSRSPGPPPVSLHLAPAGDFLYEVPAHITPSYCFADLNATVSAYRDTDKDWLADECELELARAFAPLMHFSMDEPCPDGEPAWAAKYFDASRFVRIVYLPAYYDDCGLPQFGKGGGHAGDSELIMVEVRFNASTARWEFNQMWLSAHYGTGISDRSAWVRPDEARFSQRPLGHPSVWAAYRKHANYKSAETCNKPWQDWVERCDVGGAYALRFPVQAWRNIGSRHYYLANCVASSGRFAGNGILECFWTARVWWRFVSTLYGLAYLPKDIFGGWHPNNDVFGGGAAPYKNLLMSQFFEQRCGSELYQPGPILCTVVGLDPGPGPNPPATSPPPPPPGEEPPPSECDPRLFVCSEPLARPGYPGVSTGSAKDGKRSAVAGRQSR